MVSTSDCHPRGPGFDSWLYPGNFSGSIGSGTGSTQPREDNWVATWMRSSEVRLRKLKSMLSDKCFANYKVPCTAVWQQPLQSVLALRGCSATDLIYLIYYYYYYYYHYYYYYYYYVHRCATGGSMLTCPAACPGSISGRDRFPGWYFFRNFSSPVRQMSGNFRPTRSPNIIWPL